MELNKVLERVRKMAELAEHADTPVDEANLARAMMAELMDNYAVTAAMLEAAKPVAEQRKPDIFKIDICGGGNPAKTWLIEITDQVARYCRCRMLIYGGSKLGSPSRGEIYGFPSDLSFFEILWTVTYQGIGSKISPQWSESKTEEQNIVDLHQRGLNWLDIARINPVQPGGPWRGDPDTAQKIGSRIKRIYQEWCNDTGNTYQSSGNRVQWIKSFARGYNSELYNKINHMQHGREAGTELVLAATGDKIDEFLAKEFPSVGAIKLNRSGDINWDAYSSGTRAAQELDLTAGRHEGRKEKITDGYGGRKAIQ